MKKSLIISISVLLIVIIAFSAWYFFMRDGEAPALNTTDNNSLPFGSGESNDSTDNIITDTTIDSNSLFGFGDQTTADEYASATSDLFRISQVPVAGFVTLTRGGQSVVRYVDRATGHIYDALLATGTSSLPFEKIKITNNTLPKVYEAYFRSDGSVVLLRFLKDDSDVVENISLALTRPPINSTETLYTTLATPIRGDIGSLVVGTGNTLFYVLQDNFSITSSSFSGTGAKTLLTSAFTNWRLTLLGSNLMLYTKASANIFGYAYTLNSSGGSLTKILGPLYGLVALPNAAGNQVLYSYVDRGQTKLFVKNITKNTIFEISPTTLAEKCVWSKKNTSQILCGAPSDLIGSNEPDNWYRGATNFHDRIWLFDTNADIARVLIEPTATIDVNIDATDLKLSPNEDYLVFINKIDLSLWALKLQ